MSSAWVKRLTGSLGFRISRWYALGFIGSFALLGALALWMITDSGRRADRAEIRAEFDEDLALCRQPGGTETFRGQIEREPVDLENTLIRLSEADGKTVLLRAPAGPREDDNLRWLDGQLQATRSAGWRDLPTRDREGRWQVYGERLPDGRWLEVAKSDRRERELLENLWRVLPAVALLVVLLAMGGAAALTVRALRPVRRLIDTTHAVLTAGDMTARVPVRTGGRGDELDELSGLFNQMLAKNETLIRGMREALDHVGHDLRTPLTRLHAAAEAALQRTDGTSEQRAEARAEALAEAIEESRRALDLLSILTDISQAEHGAMRLRPESLELRPLVTTAADLYGYGAEGRAIRLTVADVPAGLCVLADRTRFQQVLANLLDNAVKYSHPGSEVRVGAAPVADGTGQVRLTVQDQGIGIPAGELPRIWERLYRGDNSRSQPGSGLGLSLVRAVVEAHGGRVEVVSRPGEGSAFSVVLPGNHRATG